MSDNFSLIDCLQTLTKALHRVTDFLDDNIALKWQLRKTADELFELAKSWNDSEIADKKSISLLVGEIVDCLSTERLSIGFIAKNNLKILQKEYLHWGELIKEEKEVIYLLAKPSEPIQVQKENQEEKIMCLQIANSQLPIFIGNSNGQQSLSIISNGQSEVIHASHNGQDVLDNGHNRQDIILDIKERQKRILSLFKEGEWVTINEVSDVLADIGEKSVQRDLLEMVAKGILEKTGDKRWRKYSLAKQV